MSACPHEGAPQACPLCAIGEDFTVAGQSALSRLTAMLESAQAPARDDLAYARDCVLAREWQFAWDRRQFRLEAEGKAPRQPGPRAELMRQYFAATP